MELLAIYFPFFSLGLSTNNYLALLVLVCFIWCSKLLTGCWVSMLKSLGDHSNEDVDQFVLNDGSLITLYRLVTNIERARSGVK